MNFRTEITITQSPQKLRLKSPILTIGSCFAEVIGQQLVEHKCNVLNSPFGTVFNPKSILQLTNYCIDNKQINPELFTQNNDIFQHYDFHSNFWDKTQNDLEHKIQTTIREVQDFMTQKPTVIITLGTAFVYRHLATKNIVGNCHKTPQTAFKKELLSYPEIIECLQQIINKITPHSSGIILTVSPVRHTKDTLVLNQASKSLLRAACHEMTEAFDNVDYFPSYEIMMDDLRDYRFYKADLIHPNEQAEQYIFKKFTEAYFDAESLDFMKKWQKIWQGLHHKPMFPNTVTHKVFLEKQLLALEEVSAWVDVSAEIGVTKKDLSIS